MQVSGSHPTHGELEVVVGPRTYPYKLPQGFGCTLSFENHFLTNNNFSIDFLPHQDFVPKNNPLKFSRLGYLQIVFINS